MQIYLIGFMGAGKSTVARALAPMVHRSCIDTDEEIVKRIGMPIATYFELHGEAAFRQVEHQVLLEVSQKEDAIISCGGGVALFENNVECMKQYGKIYLLQASAELIYRRVKYDTNRPLLRGKKSVAAIRQMMEKRVPFYEKAADEIVVCDGKSAKIIANEIAGDIEN